MKLICFSRFRLYPIPGNKFSLGPFLASVALSGAVQLHGDTILTSCDEGQLRAALAQGGRVTLACEGTIVVTQPLVIATNVTLEVANSANASSPPVTLDGQGATTLLHVQRNGQLNLIGLALTRGRAYRGGAVFNDGGSITISNCTFVANVAIGGPPNTAAGGAIYSNGGELTIWRSQFVSNRITAGRFNFLSNSSWIEARGGAISMVGGILSVETCIFQQNSAAGGIFTSSDGVSTRGPSFGGAIALAGVEALLTRCIFQQNRAESPEGNAGLIATALARLETKVQA